MILAHYNHVFMLHFIESMHFNNLIAVAVAVVNICTKHTDMLINAVNKCSFTLSFDGNVVASDLAHSPCYCLCHPFPAQFTLITNE